MEWRGKVQEKGESEGEGEKKGLLGWGRKLRLGEKIGERKGEKGREMG